jgi:hypothetical protein
LPTAKLWMKPPIESMSVSGGIIQLSQELNVLKRLWPRPLFGGD